MVKVDGWVRCRSSRGRKEPQVGPSEVGVKSLSVCLLGKSLAMSFMETLME